MYLRVAETAGQMRYALPMHPGRLIGLRLRRIVLRRWTGDGGVWCMVCKSA